MTEPVQVAQRPPRSLLLFDGDCNFCRFWARRWQRAAGSELDLLPLQDANIPARFPELDRARLEESIHLIQPDGRVFRGAEAVFRSLAVNPAWAGLLWMWKHLPGMAGISEAAYRCVARHRTFFSRLTRLGWGRSFEPPAYEGVRWLFLRGLAMVYLVAFVSLWGQSAGLFGHDGILPVHGYLASAERYFDQQHIGLARYHLLPTWFWINSSDAALRCLCGTGAFFSVLLLLGIAPVLSGFVLWTLYLSLVVVGRDFLSFQWDVLLLEAGFLGIFFAPFVWWPGRAGRAAVSPAVLFLFRWLIFRLMFESGCVKLLSGDPAWRDLSVLEYHYQTQPLPTPLAWFAQQLPSWWGRSCVAGMFAIELILPFFVFGPRRLRLAVAAGFALLQVAILLTGNYGFFNYLTLLLIVLLLDDQTLARFVGWKASVKGAASGLETKDPGVGANPLPALPELGRPRKSGWGWLAAPLVGGVLLVSVGQLGTLFQRNSAWLGPFEALDEWLSPFRSINHYGLFAVMTTHRFEIEVEGSNDGQTWQAYEFKFKPGPLGRPPPFVAPYQPRLDWQMWFAALGQARDNPWFLSFCRRLLQGSPEVLSLLARDPFPKAPPRFVRAQLYEYRFTHPSQKAKTGDWWRRRRVGEYLPAVTLADFK